MPALTIHTLTPHFAAEVRGVSIRGGVSARDFAFVRRALDEHCVLVFRNQPLDDDAQVSFSERFGPLERTIGANPAGGTAFARQSNVDVNTNELIPSDDRRMDYQKGNMQWHADSTFKKTLSLCSLLSAREVPIEGGDTELVSTRALYESLSADEQTRVNDLFVEHDLLHSRRRVGFEFTKEEQDETPPVRHRFVRTNPKTQRKSLLIGAHAAQIVGWPKAASDELLDDLLKRATQPKLRYVHRWQADDLLIWDNRSTLHRATPYDASQYRRVMQRTTISDPDPR